MIIIKALKLHMGYFTDAIKLECLQAVAKCHNNQGFDDNIIMLLILGVIGNTSISQISVIMTL